MNLTKSEGYLNIRLNNNLKKEVAEIFKGLGLSHSEAIRMFYQQVKFYRGIPFEIKLPSESTKKAIKQCKENDLIEIDSIYDLV